MIWACIVVGVMAYLLGSISFSIIFTKKFAGFDVRQKGSGNAGSTNVLRTAGKKPAILTLICDVLKGVVAVLIALLIAKIFNFDVRSTAILMQIAGVLVVIGHTFPVFFGFKGGKGVATALGVLLIINWQIGLICLVFALVLMALTRIVALGSIAAAILFPVLCFFITNNYTGGDDPSTRMSYLIFGIIMALIVIFNHRTNIQRMASGTENRLIFKK